MSQHDKIRGLREQLNKELNSEVPNKVKITKLKRQIMMYGLGITGRDIKPF